MVTLAVLPGRHRPPAREFAADGLTPVPAARYIVAAFARYPVVAFSEPRHGAGGTKEFLAALIREPGFAGTGEDLVIECGNARYQDVVDRYVAGEPAADEDMNDCVVRTSRRGACRQSAGGARARLAAGRVRPAVLVRFPVAVVPGLGRFRRRNTGPDGPNCKT